MNIVDIKNEILSLTRLIPEGMSKKVKQSDEYVVEKTRKIRALLDQNPDLKQDEQVVGSILAFTKEKTSPASRQAKKDLLFSLVCTIKKGIVSISRVPSISQNDMTAIFRQVPQDKVRFIVQDEILTIPESVSIDKDELWNFIGEKKVKKLIIRQGNGKEIVYEGLLLQKIFHNTRPSLEDLTQEISVQFGHSDQLVVIETKAKLQLCGDFFASKLSGRWDAAKPIDLAGVTLHGFLGVLRLVETDELFLLAENEVHQAANYLLFRPGYPDNIIGMQTWIDNYGEVERPPLPPIEFFKDWESDCPFSSQKTTRGTHTAYYITPRVKGKELSHEYLKELAAHPNEGKTPIKIEALDGGELLRDKKIEEGYWIMVYRGYKNESAKMLRVWAERFLKGRGGYDFSTSLEAPIVWMLDPQCREDMDDKPIRCAEKFDVIDIQARINRDGITFGYVGGNSECGVMPVRRYYPSK